MPGCQHLKMGWGWCFCILTRVTLLTHGQHAWRHPLALLLPVMLVLMRADIVVLGMPLLTRLAAQQQDVCWHEECSLL